MSWQSLCLDPAVLLSWLDSLSGIDAGSMATSGETASPGSDGKRESAYVETTVDLLRRFRAGERAASERICEKYMRPLRRWATGRLPAWARDVMDTDDLVQETVVHAFNNLKEFEFRHDGALQAYLRQAIYNRIRDEQRKRRRRPAPLPLTDRQRDESPSPLDEMVGAQTMARYEKALARLTAADREAVIARVELGGSYADLAEVLGKPSPDAARMAVSRALVRLAKVMGHEPE